MRKFHFYLLCLLMLLALTACNSATSTSSTLTPLPDSSGDLQILNRTAYLDPDLIDAFKQETGINIVETSYFGDEDLLSELRSVPRKYDLAVTSDRAILILSGEGRLAPLNFSNIPDFQSVEARLKKFAFDPDNRLSVPYVWGTVGILYRTDRITSAVDSWNVIFDEQRNRQAAAQIALLDDPRTGMGAALKFLGLSLNSQDSVELTRARELLFKQRPAINRFDSAAWADPLLAGEVDVAQARSNDAAFTQFANAKLRYAIPAEGAPLWMDSLIIPKDAPHKTQAETFINFLLRAENAARLAAYTYSLSPVAEAYNKMEAGKAALFRSGYIPDDPTFKRSELIADVGAAQKEYEKIWMELKSR